MKRPISRRIFLRGLGGACVAAPFLGSLAGRSVQAQAATPPRRLIAMFTHYGCITTRFFPVTSHGALTAEDLTRTTLRHLAPFVDKLLMPRGIRGMNEWTPKMERGQGNDQHTQVCGSYFTCHPVTPNSDDPFSFAKETKFNAMPISRSLDHVIAEQLSPGRTPLYVRVGNATEGATSQVSYSAAGVPYAGLGSPSQIYSTLTGLFDGGELTPDSYQAVRGKSVIDLVRADLETLQRFDMSQADRDKLEAWKALLHDTGRIIGSAQCTTALASRLGATQQTVDAASAITPGEDEDLLTMKITASLDVADLYSNLAALSAICNANPVIVLKYPPMYTFKGLGLNYESHSLSHRITSPTGQCTTAVIDMLLTIDDYYARKFAYLVGVLNEVVEGDGRLLDNTAAVWFPEMSDGNAHNLNNLPIVQVGSAGGYFKTGCAVNVDDGSATLTQGASEHFCSNTPSTDQVVSTGTDPALANAPINKYYCNLMNALGVKAGEDGFPKLGGSGEVTHFGMYDRTEDFVGGGTNPARIHSPGEYDALKA
ncbi:DUF1552 domain-containing protein [Sorangium sp. So ce726]|uniref:DUF1552 domain-containing protein n=1 Tax=Sorangium sp. So ce726 TaxID=3133319 RepID=UPI003F63C1CC